MGDGESGDGNAGFGGGAIPVPSMRDSRNLQMWRVPEIMPARIRLAMRFHLDTVAKTHCW